MILNELYFKVFMYKVNVNSYVDLRSLESGNVELATEFVHFSVEVFYFF